ncbi:hypothetical protein [Streptomyces sp. MP131-18]|uniref:hypothetical protein n=1 Tax=Streptomyces sp. MP131-18 TaxID=1857892 RepID=UPI00097C80D4|nr:hypothetical protein [Streptomyces sp. MP131-18]ONK11357.1 hypothetical protein STBA_20880 [Streptomyces sp. MP131-18]
MLVLGLLAGSLGYLLITLLTARAAYGAQRARLIRQEELWHVGDPVDSFEHHDRSSAAVTALLFGLAWPVTVPGYFLLRCATFVITARPPATVEDRERRSAHLKQQIRTLEEALERPLEE